MDEEQRAIELKLKKMKTLKAKQEKLKKIPEFDWNAHPDSKNTLTKQEIQKAQIYLYKKATQHELFMISEAN
jgi:hypothetical protein